VRPEPGQGAVYQNRLLASLQPAEQLRLERFTHRVALESGQVLARRGEPIRAVYFPVDAITSTVVELPEGENIEVGLMGAEGVTGLSLLFDENESNSTVFVQIPGDGVRIDADDFRREIVARSSPFYHLLLRYANAFMAIVAQVAGCNAIHSVEQRLARWLLMADDRVARERFPLTQEYVAVMLGVRRASVTQAAGSLRLLGAIKYDKGTVEVLSRDRLLEASCGCYQVIAETVGRVFEPRRF
jgi:CRP-like cAMP-binding protein